MLRRDAGRARGLLRGLLRTSTSGLLRDPEHEVVGQRADAEPAVDGEDSRPRCLVRQEGQAETRRKFPLPGWTHFT